MIFMSRASITTIVLFIMITAGQLLLEYHSQYFVAYLSLCIGIFTAYIMKVYEGQ